MSRIKGTKSSAALLVAVIALVAALGGGAVAGVTISKLSQKERTQVKRISKRIAKKQARRLDRRIELVPGPQGPKGERGPAGSTSCPAGTTRLRDTAICYETSESGPASQAIAMVQCEDRNRWLPPTSVARMIAEETVPQTALWADSHEVRASAVAFSYVGGSSEYRCIGYAT